MSASEALGAQWHIEHRDDSWAGEAVHAYAHPGQSLDNGDEPIGSLHYLAGNPHIHVAEVDVAPDYRRRGVASAMYDEVLKRHPGQKIRHDQDSLTSEGRATTRTLASRHPSRHAFYSSGT